jgi:hypothetical protein
MKQKPIPNDGYFQLYLFNEKPLSGGCVNKHNDDLYIFEQHFYSPQSSNNNCLFTCINFLTNFC